MGLFIDIHAIQTLPPANLNRDENGRPKTSIYGGVPRMRVSSQAWKKAIRDNFRDTLDTAAAFGFAPAGATFERRMLGPSGFDTIIEMWLPLAWGLNMVNRSMGKADLYPFVLPPAVLEKMRFVHIVVDEIASGSSKLADAGTGGQRQRQG